MTDVAGMVFDGVLATALVAFAVVATRAVRRTTKQRDRLERLRARVGWLEGQSLQLRKRAAEADVRAFLARVGREPSLDVRALSQYGEDTLLWTLLGHRVADGRGVFIEAGAFDGKQISVTWLLEAAGWRGLLVEPIPERAEACRGNRPGSHVVAAALGAPGGPSQLEFSVFGDSEDGLGVLSSVKGVDGVSAEIAARANAKTETIRVPVVTLDAALEQASDELGAIERVDAMVLDVEGFEATALRGLDIARWRPRVVLLEDNTMGRERDAAGILESAGYQDGGWLGVNRIYVADDQPETLSLARAWTTALDWSNFIVRGL